MSIAYFPEDLDARISALEAAIQAHPDGDFRDNCLFALGLVRVCLGLETSLVIPRLAMPAAKWKLAEET